MSYLLGIDAGTSVIKAALFDAQLNTVATAARKTRLQAPHPGWAEVDMDETWQMSAAAIRAVLDASGISADAVAGVGITGNMVGAWLVDEAGQPVRNAILHTDNRTQPMIQSQLEAQPDFLEQIFSYSGSSMQPGCTLPLTRWLADNEPETLKQTAHILCCKDWLVFRLTSTHQIDPSEASVLPGDTYHRSYAEPLFDLLGIRAYRDRFTVVASSEAVIGTVTPDAAAETGLQAGTPVVAGAGDVLATGIGAGAVQPGTAYAILGTAGINGLVMQKPNLEPHGIGLTFCQPGGNWVRVMVNTLGTPNLDWSIHNLFPDLAASDDALFEALEARARNSGPGANGLTYLPYLSPTGVFAPFVEPGARAEFFGLTLDHTRDDMLRAVYEGVALSIRDAYDAMPEPVTDIRLTGGGANSAFWTQMIADITGRRVIVPAGSEFGARGSALLAGVGIGWFGSLSAAAALTSVARTHEPTPTPAYQRAYARYQQLKQVLRPVWREQAAVHRQASAT